jgi:PAS domain S-box-containing protein
MATKSSHKKQWGENIFGVAAVFPRRITVRRQMKNTLRESEEKYRSLFENARDAIILADTETGIIMDVNAAGCRLLGLPKEKIVGLHQSKIHPPEMVEKYTRLFNDHVEKGTVITDDIVIQRADSVQVPVDISASVIKAGDKMIIEGTFRDVTERKQA